MALQRLASEDDDDVVVVAVAVGSAVDDNDNRRCWPLAIVGEIMLMIRLSSL